MPRTRIKGKGLVFEFENEAYECDLISAVLLREAADTATADGIVTFCDATTAADGNVWQLQIEAIQSTDDGATTADKSLHTLVWDSAVAGGELDFTFQPHGNAVATASQPHYTGIVTVEAGAYPEVGGTAGNDSFTWSYTFTVKDNTVTKVVS
jgi:hypothetical protein